jgi:hypothetical protein
MKDIFETIVWIGKTILNVASILIFITCLCAMDSESLWIPSIGLLSSAAWIAFFILRDLDEDEQEGGEYDVQD